MSSKFKAGDEVWCVDTRHERVERTKIDLIVCKGTHAMVELPCKHGPMPTKSYMVPLSHVFHIEDREAALQDYMDVLELSICDAEHEREGIEADLAEMDAKINDLKAKHANVVNLMCQEGFDSGVKQNMEE